MTIDHRCAITGRVLSVPLVTKLWDKIDVGLPDECWEWSGCRFSNGYGLQMLEQVPGRRPRSGLAHRLVVEHIVGISIPEKHVVMHSCDNPPCCNPAHLRVGTTAENLADMRLKGRAGYTGLKGEMNPAAKLTAQTVAAIRREASMRRQTQRSIADKYGVSLALVEKIVGGRLWRTVDAGWSE